MKRYDTAKKTEKAIGEIDICEKRAVPSVSLSGSLTVEAALVLPVFMGALLLLMGLLQALSVFEQVDTQLCMTGRKMAAYSEAYDGSQAADIYRLFYSEINHSGIDKKSIVGGYAGIVLGVSMDEGSDLIELKANYRIRVPGYFVGGRNIAVSDRIYVRAWLGGQQPEEGGTGEFDNTQVYVAEHGVVYHSSARCTYLQLSVHKCQLSEIHNLRNEYGAKYVPCECCGHSYEDMAVYITDAGRAWHTNRQCSGLKRQLHGMSMQKAYELGLRPCPRCGG